MSPNDTSASFFSDPGRNDARLTLFSPTGVEVILFDSNAQQQITLVETGTYLLRIQANNLTSTGFYELGLECTP